MNFSEYLRNLHEGNLGHELEKLERAKKKKSGDKDSSKNLKVEAKKTRCWKGYEPTPGKKAFTAGSCRKIMDNKGPDARPGIPQRPKNPDAIPPRPRFPSIRPNESDKDRAIRDRMKAREEREAGLSKLIASRKAKRKVDEDVDSRILKKLEDAGGGKEYEKQRSNYAAKVKAKKVMKESSKSRLRRLIKSRRTSQKVKNKAREDLVPKLKSQESRGMKTAGDGNTDLNTATRAADAAIDAKKEREAHEKFPPAKDRKVKTKFPPLPRPR